jgi:hypothetical protein
MAFDWKSLIPVFETAGNIAELAIPGGAALIPLTQAAESAINPIIAKIGTAQSAADVTAEVMSFYGTALAALLLIQQKGGLDAATSAKIQEYIQAAQAGMTAWLQAQAGFNPANYAPVTPIV